MYYDGFTYLGKHSGKDMGLTIASREFNVPNKIKRIKRPPFSNKDIDFSEIYGSQIYDNKTIKYQINIFNQRIRSKHEMNTLKTKVVNWLMNSNGKQKLYDDYYYGYYFLAEVEGGVSFEENWIDGTLDVTFTCYPFMISELQEGHDLWDNINFELDVLQPTSFEVAGTKDIVLINVGTPDVIPRIISDSNFVITTEGKSFSVGSGTTEDADFTLTSGENKLKLEGNGNIEFVFYKELI